MQACVRTQVRRQLHAGVHVRTHWFVAGASAASACGRVRAHGYDICGGTQAFARGHGHQARHQAPPAHQASIRSARSPSVQCQLSGKQQCQEPPLVEGKAGGCQCPARGSADPRPAEGGGISIKYHEYLELTRPHATQTCHDKMKDDHGICLLRQRP